MLKHYYESLQITGNDFEKRRLPMTDITEKTEELLNKVVNQLNENKKPEEWILKSDILGNALEEYATKLGIKI